MYNTCFLKRQNVLLVGLMLLTLIGFSSCAQQDDNTLYRNLIGYSWIGDLGFENRGYAVNNIITFKGNDYAVDDQYFMDNGEFATTMTIRWWVDGATLWMDYGGINPMFEIRDLFVGSEYLSGTLYVNGAYEGYIRMDKYYY